MKVNEVTEAIIGAAIEVHRTIGPGLQESAYVQCLGYELALRQIPFQWELPLPVQYKGLKLDCGYRLDLVVADAVVVEVKAVDRITPSSTFRYCVMALYGGCWHSMSPSSFSVVSTK